MKQTRINGKKKLWYAVDKDGWGKLFKQKPERNEYIWTAAALEPEPTRDALIKPRDAELLGKTWEDEPSEVEVMYDKLITIRDEK